jgi:hypothetical protein
LATLQEFPEVMESMTRCRGARRRRWRRLPARLHPVSLQRGGRRSFSWRWSSGDYGDVEWLRNRSKEKHQRGAGERERR